MQIKREDLSFTYSADGFMLQFKGKNIGGAGVTLPREKRLSPKQRQENLRDFKESAECDIEALVAGRGQARYMLSIKTIEANTTATS